ncbi:MAG TPA: signal peptidase II [Patescibacteria group bacterium]|nr:signal peptidase II [Patescibacteria group bacterium]
MREKERTVNKALPGGLIGIWLADRLSKLFFLRNSQAIVNQGLSWGVALTFSTPFLIFLSLLILIFCGFLFLFWPLRRFELALIFIGGLSNLIDRLFLGGVVDFIHLPFVPVFNLADITIGFGGLLLLVDLLKTKKLS